MLHYISFSYKSSFVRSKKQTQTNSGRQTLSLVTGSTSHWTGSLPIIPIIKCQYPGHGPYSGRQHLEHVQVYPACTLGLPHPHSTSLPSFKSRLKTLACCVADRACLTLVTLLHVHTVTQAGMLHLCLTIFSISPKGVHVWSSKAKNQLIMMAAARGLYTF